MGLGSKLYRLHLNNGEVIECTDCEHLFYMGTSYFSTANQVGCNHGLKSHGQNCDVMEHMGEKKYIKLGNKLIPIPSITYIEMAG